MGFYPVAQHTINTHYTKLHTTLKQNTSHKARSTRNLPGVKGRLTRKADNLTAICESIIYKIWEPRRLTILWASTASLQGQFYIYIVI
jgi:hypothetical protein